MALRRNLAARWTGGTTPASPASSPSPSAASRGSSTATTRSSTTTPTSRGLVSRRVHLDIFNDTPDQAPPPAPATAGPARRHPAAPCPAPARTRPVAPTRPRQPCRRRAGGQRAEGCRGAPANPRRGGELRRDHLCGGGPNSAVDQAQQPKKVLMAGTADDHLRNVGAITRRGPRPSGGRRRSPPNNLPGGPAPRRAPRRRDRARPRHLRPRGQTRDLPRLLHPAPAPETDTCGADASAVARCLRTNLGASAPATSASRG